ncbi:hypothetical protein [Streptomyces sp. NPDC058755]|uniref:hypothetical protein n=1 Tax=Streptomyces sp. NPDC058755 TaxID=3346624 RepID=UPI0036B44C4E
MPTGAFAHRSVKDHAWGLIMHTTFRGRRLRRILLSGSFLIAASVCAACSPSGSPGSGAAGISDDSFPAATRPGAVVVVCLDTSSSYPTAERESARNTVAKALPKLVVPGRKASTVYVYTIGVNTYGKPPKLELNIPALRGKPAAVGTSSGPLQGSRVSGNAEKFDERWGELRDQALSAARAEGRRLDALKVSASESGTDLGGCLKNASEQFADPSRKGPRHLVMASDLDPNGLQQQSTARMAGATVSVVDFTCSQAVRCDARKTRWTKKFRELGATAVAITRPGYPEHLFEDSAGSTGGGA